MTTCARPGCSAEIFWARTVNGRPMPVDYEPHPQGNVVFGPAQGGRAGDARVLRKGEQPPAGQRRWMAHWVTCADPPPRKGKRKR